MYGAGEVKAGRTIGSYPPPTSIDWSDIELRALAFPTNKEDDHD